MKKGIIKKCIIIGICMFFLLVVVFPYIKVELLTFFHGDEFPNIVEDIAMIDGMEYIKVMEYNDDKAEVLCVSGEHAATVLCRYEKKEDVWSLDGWECIWSRSGSASELIWPFYR